MNINCNIRGESRETEDRSVRMLAGLISAVVQSEVVNSRQTLKPINGGKLVDD